MTPNWENARVLIYTVTRADTPARMKAAAESLLRGQKTAGFPHEWVLYANSWQMHEWGAWQWRNGRMMGTGENVGQHVALQDVLMHATGSDTCRERLMGHRCEFAPKLHMCKPRYDFIIKVDDDVEWMTRNWLRKLIIAAHSIHAFSGRWNLVGPRVFGLTNPIEAAGEVSIPSVVKGAKEIPLRVMPILGGLVRLHHISFFKDYFLDVRRAMGSGGDTTIAEHARDIPNDGKNSVGSMACKHVRVRHCTREQQAADPEYHRMHRIMQLVPFMPVLKLEATQ